MLNHNLKHHLLPSALLVTGFLTLTGCTAHPINQGEDSFIPQKIYTFVP